MVLIVRWPGHGQLLLAGHSVFRSKTVQKRTDKRELGILAMEAKLPGTFIEVSVPAHAMLRRLVSDSGRVWQSIQSVAYV
jgi:hypothetical protein